MNIMTGRPQAPSAWLLIASMTVALSMGGCASRSPDTGRGSYKIGTPYTIAGRTYYPAEDWSYAETGVASWYGPGFHGNATANGEPYNQNLPSAAHRTLPMPSIVRVTNLDNGRSSVVRVNDRGPFAQGRIIDLSKAAAEQLDMTRAGTARVRVEIMERESRIVKDIAMNGGSAADQLAALRNPPTAASPATAVASPAPVVVAAAPPPPAPAIATATAPLVQASAPPVTAPAIVPAAATPPPGAYFVQAGAFANLTNAERLRGALRAYGDATIAQGAGPKGAPMYRVRVGPYRSEDQAFNVRDTLVRAGHGEARVVSD
jgi:rare lipoprotein A